MSVLRLYLTPYNGQQRVIDVDAQELIMSNGAFTYPGAAPSVTLVEGVTSSQFTTFGTDSALVLQNQNSREVRVCWREPVGTSEFPGEVVQVPDPANGACVCGITCAGTNLAYVVVSNVQQ